MILKVNVLSVLSFKSAHMAETRNTGQLAEHALDSRGDRTAYTYGASPNDHSHWDRLTQYGCICDHG